jgi:hypothetical protein
MQPIARRKLMQGGAALAVAAAVPTGALANAPAAKTAQAEDAELRALWEQYLGQIRIYEKVDRAADKARAAYEAELPPCPEGVYLTDHYYAHRSLWQKHRLSPLCDATECEFQKLARLVKAIRKAKAESLFGIGVKLSVTEAEPEECDFKDARTDALRTISALTGVNFTSVAKRLERRAV